MKKEPERVLGKVCDIDAQKKKERELQEKSQRDSLTGLLNHSTIKQQITHRLQKMKRGQVGTLLFWMWIVLKRSTIQTDICLEMRYCALLQMK